MMFPGSTHHLFNHANGWENLFNEPKNYEYFLGRLWLHVLPAARILGYSLMPDHFHLVVKIRKENELIKNLIFPENMYFEKEVYAAGYQFPYTDIDETMLIKKVSKSFSNAFNSYTQAFNKMYDRKGSLFRQNMKSEEIYNDGSLCKVLHYIHANPIYHQFVTAIDKWPYSSYKTFLNKSPTRLERDYVLDIFGGLDWFIKYHEQPIDPGNKWLE